MKVACKLVAANLFQKQLVWGLSRPLSHVGIKAAGQEIYRWLIRKVGGQWREKRYPAGGTFSAMERSTRVSGVCGRTGWMELALAYATRVGAVRRWNKRRA